MKTSNAIVALLCLVLALVPSSVRAADMFRGKDDVGEIWLQIVGRIEDGDEVKFRALLMEAINRGEQVSRVSIYSSGGQLAPAIKIGRYIRSLYLSTVAPQLVPLYWRHYCIYRRSGRATLLEFDPRKNQGDPRCVCIGECFLIWVSGVTRHGEATQIRRMTVDRQGEGTAGDGIVESYLREMGVTDAAISRILEIDRGKVEYLGKEASDALTKGIALPWLRELFDAGCGQHAPTSPNRMSCEMAIHSELYWNGARRLLTDHE
jgi:hypothetical protein